MNKLKYFTNPLFAVCVAIIFSSAAYAQNGNSHHNRGRGAGNNERHYTRQAPNNSSAGNNRVYYDHPNNRNVNRPNYYPAYRPNYRPNYYPVYHPPYRTHYVPGYVYYPGYHYRPVYRSPYVYPHFGPAFGVRITVLPFGYYPFYIGNNPFYYYQGIYYRPYSNGGYEVIAPPLGATVKHLPSGAKLTIINGEKYYELGGTFYQEEITDKNKLEYVVVGTDGVINTIDQSQLQPEDGPGANYSPESSEQGTTN
jgi:hypothetical protein